MMPHPERASDDRLGGRDGRMLFESLCAALS
jgi:phosphoribosylformylglycinamidine (FGAM) synthase-like amidotransferase family enzyme